VLLTDLEKFGKDRDIKFVRSLTIQDVREFRASWKDGAISAHKKLERVRAFLSFCVSSNWLDENPAKGVKPPKVTMPPTLPFSDEEMARILKACDQYPRKNSLGLDNRARIKAFVLLLRYSGLRLQDATTLERPARRSICPFRRMSSRRSPRFGQRATNSSSGAASGILEAR
jgi:site-specific recombinase XerD